MPAGRQLTASLQLDTAIITLDKDGMAACCRRDGRCEDLSDPATPGVRHYRRRRHGRRACLDSPLRPAPITRPRFGLANSCRRPGSGKDRRRHGHARGDHARSSLLIDDGGGLAPQGAKIKNLAQLMAEIDLRAGMGPEDCVHQWMFRRSPRGPCAVFE